MAFPYLNLLRELSQIYDVNLNSYNGVWEVNLTLLHQAEVVHGAQGDTPEEAIRKVYLSLHPIPRNEYSGSMSQNQEAPRITKISK